MLSHIGKINVKRQARMDVLIEKSVLILFVNRFKITDLEPGNKEAVIMIPTY